MNGGTGYVSPTVTITDYVLGPGTGAAATAVLNLTSPYGGMHKFVDGLPGIPGVTTYTTGGYNSDGSNLLNQYIPVAVSENRR